VGNGQVVLGSPFAGWGLLGGGRRGEGEGRRVDR